MCLCLLVSSADILPMAAISLDKPEAPAAALLLGNDKAAS